ncbi:MAG TPA: DNA mismatch repair endonuclease MutL [Vitreimonas sp.]|nr:DNA mismatch repair endonuclease MutL [Vitreimonas sp.]
MSRIKPLPAAVIAAIAAGEVVERPAVIVKELIENALDAGATRIMIELENGGVDKILVNDNGEGMSADDLELAIQRHTTSKIATVQDLEKIMTLGFRGEALASIAGVSQLEIISRPVTNEVGSQLRVEHGRVSPISQVGAPIGTTVIVSDLFGQLPARRKFLKKPQTELRVILETVMALAIQYYQVEIQMSNNRKNVFSAPAHQDQAERITALFGTSLSTHLVPVEFNHEYLFVTGWVGKPQLGRKTTDSQYLFVNQRWVTHPKLAKTVKESFGSLLEPKMQPVFIFNVELPPGLVDINLHPRKELVKFWDDEQVLTLIDRSLRSFLSDHSLTYEIGSGADPRADLTNFRYDFSPVSKKASLDNKNDLKNLVTTWQLGDQGTEVLQVLRTYLITETVQGMIMVDQHAAHERILYNQFLAAYEAEFSYQPQTLLSPQVITLTAAEYALFEEHLATFSKLGFEMEPYGYHTLLISQVPRFFQDRDLTTLIHEVIDELKLGQPVAGVDSVAQRTLAYLACRSAVKAGDVLTPDQRRELLIKLANTEHRFTCPHGRPTTIIMSQQELEKLFKRRT